MRAHTPSRQFGLLFSIGFGVVTGAVAIAVVGLHDHILGDTVALDDLVSEFRSYWDWWLAGGVAGGVLGAFCWILWRPGTRFTRRMLPLVTINWAAWIGFLLFTPQVATARFEEIAHRRAQADRYGVSALDATTDRPTILAARYFGGFRGMPPPELSLSLMAGVPAFIAERYVVPVRYPGSPPTRRESYVIAVIAFLLSTAFWATIGGAIGSLWRSMVRLVTAQRAAAGVERPDATG